MNKQSRPETALLLLMILLLGAYFRFVGIDWGEGQAIHPDEEHLRQVTSAIRLPDSLGQYFDTATSPLNPHNRGHGFFVYGTLPLFLTRAAGEYLDAGCEPPHSLPARLLAPWLIGRPVDQCWPGSFSYSRVIGRFLAALFDMGSILFVFLAGRRMISAWGGLLAALLYALSMLVIQQAHFYTVDAFAGLFAAATLYLVIRAFQTGGWVTFALAGLTTGLGMACKISVWPLGGLVALAAALWGATDRERRRRAAEAVTLADEAHDEAAPPIAPPSPSYPLAAVFSRIALAGLFALLAFRVAQPYAFSGPGWLGVRLNPQWLGNMAEVSRMMSGTVVAYHGYQWIDRAPLVFPWVNMVVWGLGIPLGLVAWTAWGVAGVEILRRRREVARMAPLLLVWVWGTAYFVYQGVQWVKSIRYFVPIYGAFALLAAWLVIWLDGRRETGRRRRPRLALAVGALAVVGALLWALAGSSIYTRTHTRIAASRWIFENVPTAATIHVQTAEGARRVPAVIPSGMVYAIGDQIATPFRVDEEANLARVTLNRVRDPRGDLLPRRFRVAVATDPSGQVLLAEAIQEIGPPPAPDSAAYAFPLASARLLPDTTYYLLTELVEGDPLELRSSILATEHWDWAPPLRVDGYDPFGGMYRGLSTSSDGSLQLYHEDSPEKRASLLEWLDEADYIITGSNRLYASIPRRAERYPITLAYYEALFNGELGFELLADFRSPMALGPFQFPDQEEPFPIPEAAYQYRPAPISVRLPPAEETFSVYDHPRVLVFAKTEAYSRARAEALLPASLLQTMVSGDNSTRDALLDPEDWAAQRAGGTWSAVFDRRAPLNRWPGLGAAAWYLAAALLGWLAFPILFAALPRLRDRGYGLARPLGLLLVGYLTWLAASLHLLPNTRATLALMTVVVAAAGGLVAWRRWDELAEFLRTRWQTLLIQEGLFLLLFVFWVAVRMRNPDLWHPVVGGEKPMDFAYFNAVLRSTSFPPYDPWLAGGYLNYYYFGFVLAGVLTKLLGIVPSIAYNLILPLFYAMTGSAAFSAGLSLIRARENEGRTPLRPILAGVLAVLLVLVLGNLGELRVIANGLRTLGGEPPFASTIPGLPELIQIARGFGQIVRGQSLPIRPETPYWEPTRMVPHPGFTEFPSFVFLYGDPHANMFALPYALTMIVLALNWARGGWRLRAGWLLSGPLGGLVIGSLWATNTWDYPTYLLVGLGGVALGTRLSSWRRAGAAAWRAALLIGLSLLLFAPFIARYVTPVTRLTRMQDEPIPVGTYLLLMGQFLFPLVTLLAAHVRRLLRPVWLSQDQTVRLGVAMIVGGVVLAAVAITLFDIPLGLVTVPLGAAALALVLNPKIQIEQRVAWFLLALSMAICLAVDLVSVGGDRMNTVAKFYYQVWLLLAVAATGAVVWVTDRMSRWSADRQQIWTGAMVLIVLSMALFPIMSLPAKVNDRFEGAYGATLDGMAYLKQAAIYYDPLGPVQIAPDYGGIVWLQENVIGSPVIMEGLGLSEYRWGNRVSIYTGLPAVVGWRWHQVQQRMAGTPGEVERRHRDVNDFYNTTDVQSALGIVARYEVEYIYVGPYEQMYYDQQGLDKLQEMVERGYLRLVYDEQGVRIYRVVR